MDDYEEMLMTKAAWHYYFEGITQQQAAERMGISRMRVIKLLEKARQTGIIQFRLRKDGETRMKMELALKAPRDGVVAEIRAQVGDFVEGDAVLATLEP